jgi:hypothetical protein
MRNFLQQLIHCQDGHLPAAWEGDTDGCMARATCVRCGKSMMRRAHVWGAWTPTGNGCMHIKTCERCGTQLNEALHAWRRENRLLHVCSACGANGMHRPIYGSQTGRCASCGEEVPVDTMGAT